MEIGLMVPRWIKWLADHWKALSPVVLAVIAFAESLARGEHSWVLSVLGRLGRRLGRLLDSSGAIRGWGALSYASLLVAAVASLAWASIIILRDLRKRRTYRRYREDEFEGPKGLAGITWHWDWVKGY